MVNQFTVYNNLRDFALFPLASYSHLTSPHFFPPPRASHLQRIPSSTHPTKPASIELFISSHHEFAAFHRCRPGPGGCSPRLVSTKATRYGKHLLTGVSFNPNVALREIGPPQTVPASHVGTEEQAPGAWAALGTTIPWTRGRQGAMLKSEFLENYAGRDALREPLLRENRVWEPLKFFQMIGSRLENIEAFVMTVKGEYPATPCDPCRRGLGTWARCVRGYAGIPGTPEACNNCHHGGQGTRCNFDTRDHVSSHRVGRSSEDASASGSPTYRTRLRQLEGRMADARALALRLQDLINRQNEAVDTISAERNAANVLNSLALDHLFAQVNTTAERLETLAEELIYELNQ